MRISTYLYTSVAPDVDAQANFRDELDEQVATAARAGFAGTFMPEHHAARNGFPPPFQFLTWLAARNPGIMVGTNIALAPLYHPLVLAESIATLDWLTSGNLVCGFGSGFRPAEFNAVGANVQNRFGDSREVLKVVDKLLRGERVSFRIGPWIGDEVSIAIRPVQVPRPPFLWAAMRPSSLKTALHCADGLIPNQMGGLETQLELLNAFDMQRGSRCPVRPVTMEVVLADSRAKAERRAVVRLGAEYASFKHWPTVVPELAKFNEDPAANVGLLRRQAIIGPPEDVYDTVLRLQEAGVTDLILRLQHAETGQAEVLEAIRAIGSEVMPRISRTG